MNLNRYEIRGNKGKNTIHIAIRKNVLQYVLETKILQYIGKPIKLHSPKYKPINYDADNIDNNK